MRMKPPCLAAFLAGSLIAFAAQGQDEKKPEPGPGETPDPQIIESIMDCLAEGLTPDWKKAWFVIKEVDRNVAEGARQFEGDFFFATRTRDSKGKPLRTCGAERIVQGVSDLNDYLSKDKQSWTSATFTFLRDGKYDVKYDYTPFKPKPAAEAPAEKPVAKSAAKKKAEAAK